MAYQSLVTRLLNKKPRELAFGTKESLNWFRENVKNIRINYAGSKRLLAEGGERVTRVREGRIYMYFYHAKGEEKLPYFDRFPLVICVDRQPTYFTGLNLHYLSPRLRVEFLSRLDEYLSDRQYDEETKFRLTYDLIANIRKLRAFRPCFKKYLYSQVRSRIIEVPPNNWEVISLLPAARFTVNANTVYADSRKIIEAN